MGNELAINPKTIYAEIQKFKPEIERALPRHMTPDRMARIALTQLRVNPKLFDCSFESFMGSIMAAAQLGLEPGVNGQCYLVPYAGVCTLVPGWKGLMDLVSRAGRSSAWTGVVRPGDFFEYRLGSNPKLEHEPGDDDEGNFTHIYAVGWVKEAQWPIIEVWSRSKVEKHLRQYNKVGDRHYAKQNENNLEMYGRKVALLQVIKYLPSSVELRDAAELDNSAGEGKQNLTIDMALGGDLAGGGPSPDWAEAEGIMQKLNWDDSKRNMFRQNYTGKITDGLAYLKSEQQRASRGTQGQPATEKAPAPAAASAPPQGQQEQAPQQQATTRRRGGNRQQAEAPQAAQPQEEDSTSPSTAQQTESGPGDGTQSQPENLFQTGGAEHPAVASAKKEWF
jgi:recombination protein RecT